MPTYTLIALHMIGIVTKFKELKLLGETEVGETWNWVRVERRSVLGWNKSYRIYPIPLQKTCI